MFRAFKSLSIELKNKTKNIKYAFCWSRIERIIERKKTHRRLIGFLTSVLFAFRCGNWCEGAHVLRPGHASQVRHFPHLGSTRVQVTWFLQNWNLYSWIRIQQIKFMRIQIKVLLCSAGSPLCIVRADYPMIYFCLEVVFLLPPSLRKIKGIVSRDEYLFFKAYNT